MGKYWNDVWRYCRDASVATDGTLIVKAPPAIESGKTHRERIVVPKPLAVSCAHSRQPPCKGLTKALFLRNSNQ